MDDDARKRLSDDLIREMNAEIDRDTIARWNRGERLVKWADGYHWTYITNKDGKVVDENGKLLD